MKKISLFLAVICAIGCLSGCDVDAKLREDGSSTIMIPAAPGTLPIPDGVDYEIRDGVTVFSFTSLSELSVATGVTIQKEELSGRDVYSIDLPELEINEESSFHFQFAGEVIDVRAEGADVEINESEVTLSYSGTPISPAKITVYARNDLPPFLKLRDYRGQFKDVGVNEWYRKYMISAYELGFVEGTSDNTFSPNKNITLAEIITLAARVHSTYLHDGHEFTAIEGGKWYTPYIEYAIAEGIIPATFGRYEQVATRAELAYIFANCLPDEMYELLYSKQDFKDVKAADIAYYPSIMKLYNAGIINGTSESEFSPYANTTRAQVVTIAARLALANQRV